MSSDIPPIMNERPAGMDWEVYKALRKAQAKRIKVALKGEPCQITKPGPSGSSTNSSSGRPSNGNKPMTPKPSSVVSRLSSKNLFSAIKHLFRKGSAS